jgi:general secretion pathway protein A
MTGMNDDAPFSLSPDPRFLYLTPALRTALHKLRYVIDRRQGLSAVLGDFGLGKSSLMRKVYEEYLARPDCAVAFIHTPTYKSDYAFLKGICAEFGLASRRSLPDQQGELQAFCIEQFAEGRNVLLLIDDGQKLDSKMLEVVRTLTNFETSDRKLIQTVLAGQIELHDRLLEEKQGALRSRIAFPTHLSALTLLEAGEMLAFRCQEAQIPNPFRPETIEEIYRASNGVPREVLKTAAMAYELMLLAGDTFVPPEAIALATKESKLQERAAVN